MRTLPLVLVVAALLVVPPVNAGSTFSGALPATASLILGPPVPTVPASTPVLQSSAQYNFILLRGDTITVDLTYADASNGFAVANDIDLRLLLPSAAPVPINTADPVATAQGTVAVRVARQTCTDAAAHANQHPILGDANGAESLSFTVPADGEQGTYSLLLLGFFLSASQPFDVSVTVNSGGSDVTAARYIPPAPGLTNLTTFVTTAPYCQLI
jgi:hypothetical protein